MLVIIVLIYSLVLNVLQILAVVLSLQFNEILFYFYFFFHYIFVLVLS